MNNLLQKFAQSVGNFRPAQAIVSAIPGGNNINTAIQGLGLQNKIQPTLGQIGQNIQKQGNIQTQGIQAHIKRSQGKKITPQEQAAMDASDRQAASTVVAGLTGDINTGGINPADFKTGTSFVRDAQGNLHANPNPQPAQYTQNTSAADAFTANPGAPKTPEEEAQPQWPQAPQKVQSASMKKPFKLPGIYDPIDEVKASNATSNSKAYSVTTPDIQDAYRRNGITDPNQVYSTKQSLYDQVINPALEADTTRLPLGEVGKADGIIPRIVKEMQTMDPTMDDQTAMNAANSMINRINGLAQSETGGAIVPKDIGLKNIMDYRTSLNQSTAVKNLLNGQLPTAPSDVATVATRNVLSGLLDKYAPSGISQAVKDYGLLEEGFPSYLKAFTTERDPFSLTDAVAGKKLGEFIPPAVKLPIDLAARGVGAAAQNPAGRLVLAGAAGAGLAAGLPAIKNILQNTGNNYAQSPQGQKGQPEPIHGGSIPQDPTTGHYQLPGNPNITPLTPGTPEYTRANAALPGNSRQFMVNAPQYMNSINSIQDDVKGGMPLDILHQFKTIKDLQGYMSNPSNPYAKQLSDIGQLNSKFRAAYTQINGTAPDDSQMLSPGDSKEQFTEKYNEMVNFIYNNYSQFQVPYLQTTETPTTPQGAGNGQGTTQYSLPPIQQNANSIVGGTPPTLNFPALPPIQ